MDVKSILKPLKHFKLTQEDKLIGMRSPPISLFCFDRIVIDEYTYLEDHQISAISLLRAPNRWVLSGTPELVDFADLKCLAALINVNLGIDHDASIALQKSSIKNVQKERTGIRRMSVS